MKLRHYACIAASAALPVGYALRENKYGVYESALMPAVRLLPPEVSHKFGVWACKHKLYPTPKYVDQPNLQTEFFGRALSNPLGIAAGFDKNGDAIEGLHGMGFSFIEIGSVTPKPQPGNTKPRVFRLEADRAVINRYGFNNDGHQVVLERLLKARHNPKFSGVVGVNLGKNALTTHAYEDYVKGVEYFGPHADYLVINVSSPNTKGLRDLQGKVKLEQLLTPVLSARNKLPVQRNVPILLKLSPDLTPDDVKDICVVISKPECKVDGLIVANTTTARGKLNSQPELVNQTGGLSGEPLKARSTKLIAQIYALTQGSVPIIGVGGVSSGADAYEKIAAGASCVQLYTALVYHGPVVVPKIKAELATLLERKRYANVNQLVGSENRKYLEN